MHGLLLFNWQERVMNVSPENRVRSKNKDVEGGPAPRVSEEIPGALAPGCEGRRSDTGGTLPGPCLPRMPATWGAQRQLHKPRAGRLVAEGGGLLPLLRPLAGAEAFRAHPGSARLPASPPRASGATSCDSRRPGPGPARSNPDTPGATRGKEISDAG